jgi:poly(3-hydroxybutyrate) depolymerase
VRDAIEQTQREFSIDPRRICIHGLGSGGSFAWNLAFKHRDLVRAAAVISAPLREAPPDNDPDFRLQTCCIVGGNDPSREKIERSVEVLRKLKFPTRLIVVPDLGEAYPPEESLEELVRWVDSLDRI